MPPETDNIASLVCPALNILRAIELNFQEHECIYQHDCAKAVNNLLKLIKIGRIVLPKCEHCKEDKC